MENNWNNTIGGRQQTLYYFESICVMEDGARGGIKREFFNEKKKRVRGEVWRKSEEGMI